MLTLRVVGQDELDRNRPLHLASLMLDAAIWKKEPFGYRLTNVLLHALNASLLFAFLTIALQSKTVVAGGGDAEAGNASPADTERLTQNGWAVYVEGVATKADVTKRFAWGFEGTQRYFPCESTATFTAGVAEVQLTIHGDHLFYDDLTAEEPNVAFDVVASADTDDDGEITVEELTARDITGEARYQVGSFPVTNLYAFIEHQIGTLGHIDGEGHCETGGE